MFLFSWMRNRNANSKKRASLSRKPTRFRPGLELLEDRAVPAILSVTTHVDVVDANDGLLSLREAIQQADPATVGGDTIVFDTSLNGQTIALNGSELLINKNLNIQGPGVDLVAISGNAFPGIPHSRVFEVAANVQVSVADLTIRNGEPSGAGAFSGGGIYNAGTLTIRACAFTGNSAGRGGAVANVDGNITISDSTFADNFADFGGAIRNERGTVTINHSTFTNNGSRTGGAIRNDTFGTLTLSGCTFSGNLVNLGVLGGHGGAIYNTGSLGISDCSFSGNLASYGGAIHNTATLTVSNSTFSANAASSAFNDQDGYGGAIYTGGNVSISSSTFSGNWTTHDGGAIYNYSSALSVSGCNFSGNSAQGVVTSTGISGGFGGGIYNQGSGTIASTTFSNNSARVGGGGVAIKYGTVTITGCTLTGNSAAQGGAIYGNTGVGSLTIAGCTISGNSADIGGGIWSAYASKAPLTIKDSTITSNSATSKGGGLYNYGAATIQNTSITSNNGGLKGGGIFNDVSGVLTLYSTSTVTGNLATDGADIFNLGRITKRK